MTQRSSARCRGISQPPAILARISPSLEQKTPSIAIKPFDHSLNPLLSAKSAGGDWWQGRVSARLLMLIGRPWREVL